MSINAPGIGSGLDIEGLVQQLLAAEAQPSQLRLNRREARLQSRLSGFGVFKSALDQLRTALAGLKDINLFNGRGVSIGNEALFSATAQSSAATGSYAIEVVRLAQAQKLASGPVASATTTVGYGTLTIDIGGSAFSVEIDSGAASLADIRSAINAAPDNTGVSATLVTANDGVRLVLTGNQTGVAKNITVTQSGGDGGLAALVYDPANMTTNLTSLQAAQDAQIQVDGFAYDSADNVISEAISGLTLTLKSAAPGSPTTLGISNDTGGSGAKVSGFVEAYNKALKTLQGLGAFNAATGSGGALLGDATLRSFMGSLRNEVVKSLTGNGNYAALFEIGITTAVDGTLNVDGVKLDAALANNFNDVGRLFGTESTGVAQRLDALIAAYVDSNGLISSRTEGIQDSVEGINSAREALDRRLEQVERRLRSQFAALDTLVAQFRSTGDFLTQQLENLSPVNNRRR